MNLPAFRGLIDFHIAEGTDGIVVVGTTGEFPTVDVEEHELLIAEAVKHAAKRIPIIAGTRSFFFGTNISVFQTKTQGYRRW